MAGDVSITDVFDRVFTSTRTTIIPKLWDNITANIPVIYWLQLEGQIETHSGGAALEFNIFKELITAVGAKATQKVTPTYVDPITRGRYLWKNIYVPFKIPGIDLRKNQGPNAIIDLLQAVVEVSQASMTAALGGATLGIWSSADETDETVVTGFGNLVRVTNNTTGNTGNISRTNTFWQNSTGTAITSFATNGVAGWRGAMFNAMRGNEIPNAIVTNLTQYLNYLATLTGTYRVNFPMDTNVTNRGLVDAGFPDIGFHGALVIQDANATANLARALNSKFLKLRVHEETNLYLRPFVLTEDEDAISSMLIWMGNLTCTNLARQGIVSGGDTA